MSLPAVQRSKRQPGVAVWLGGWESCRPASPRSYASSGSTRDGGKGIISLRAALDLAVTIESSELDQIGNEMIRLLRRNLPEMA